jgi:DNA-binding XRE family transcriptional regulator
MANLASLLKSEISRIARKEVRAETQTLKKASAQHRSEIAALKRRLADQERLLSQLRKNNRSAASPTPAADSPKLRFRSEGFASLRKKLGVSAAEMGQLVGVSAQSIYHWEKGLSRPRNSQLAEIAAVRKLGKREVSARLAQA